MKRWFTLLAVLLVSLSVVIRWANHPEDPLPSDVRADLIVVEKSKRELAIYSQGKLLKTYKVALGREPVGPKRREGDKKTPEGRYTINYRKADSGYFRALHISYPSQADAETARKEGVSPGGDIMIHGLRNGMGWVGLASYIGWLTGRLAV